MKDNTQNSENLKKNSKKAGISIIKTATRFSGGILEITGSLISLVSYNLKMVDSFLTVDRERRKNKKREAKRDLKLSGKLLLKFLNNTRLGFYKLAKGSYHTVLALKNSIDSNVATPKEKNIESEPSALDVTKVETILKTDLTNQKETVGSIKKSNDSTMLRNIFNERNNNNPINKGLVSTPKKSAGILNI